VPTLLIWGENDGLAPPKFGTAYQRAIPGAKLVVIPQAGHAPFEEQPDAFLAAFDQFLEFHQPR
jgi:pimeloyl-ACP methyl ester carboxylesterase